MQRHRARSAALVSGLAGLLATTALATPGLAFAQAPAAPPPAAGAPVATAPAPPPQPAQQPVTAQTGVIQRFVVRGNERIEPSTVISYLPMSLGETVDAAKIDAGIKALARTELFSNETIELINGGDGHHRR